MPDVKFNFRITALNDLSTLTCDPNVICTYTIQDDLLLGDGPSERNPIRTKAFFDLIERKISL